MADALKTFFSPELVRRIGDDLARAEPSFPVRAFVRDATEGLDGMELLARARHIAAAMARHLPGAYPDAIAVILRSLGPEHASDELIGVGMAPFVYLPHVLFVAERGLDDFDLSMRAQYELTKRFSAESSVRSYIAKDPERALCWFGAWISDPNPHVRRLVSEGTRLRLPWAARVAWLDANPERVLALLESLKDDPASVVRRSVANSLNDLGKVHPRLLTATAERWVAGASPERRALLAHALRSAVKRGDRRALRVLGFGGRPRVTLEGVKFAPRRAAIGGAAEVAFALRSTSRARQALLVDLAVHFVKANGAARPKVFKLRRAELAPGGRAEFRARISLGIHTTRKPRPGEHAVDVLVNGIALRAGSFRVVAAE